MGLWNTHGMTPDDEIIEGAVEDLGLMGPELAALAEHCGREAWVWGELAGHKKGQEKRKANLIAKHFRLRQQKWIDLTAEMEMQYEHDFGIFSDSSKLEE